MNDAEKLINMVFEMLLNKNIVIESIEWLNPPKYNKFPTVATPNEPEGMESNERVLTIRYKVK